MSISVKNIEASIALGSKYLLQSLCQDNGIKYEDEQSTLSGVWVTAEALEFFFTSRSIPIVSFSKVQPLLEYLLKQQRKDGSWTMLSENPADKSSTISTGHCTYVLKLAASGGFIDSSIKRRVLKAIASGEKWLMSCCVDKNGYVCWGLDGSLTMCEPEQDERNRISYIFTTFYAVMGLVNPPEYSETASTDNSNVLLKTIVFFKNQLDWFLNQYATTDLKELHAAEAMSNITSTFCRLINAYALLGIHIDVTTSEKISRVLDGCSINPFSTTKVVLDNKNGDNTGSFYTNNTPFDMGIALLNLKTNIQTVQKIVEKYLNNQNSHDGSWYLNFHASYKIKTWTTAEALLVLEKAFRIYSILEIEERKRNIQNTLDEKEKVFNKKEHDYTSEITSLKNELTTFKSTATTTENQLNEKEKKVRSNLIGYIILNIIFAAVILVGISFWVSLPEVKDRSYVNVIQWLVIPFAVMIIYDAIKLIKNVRK